MYNGCLEPLTRNDLLDLLPHGLLAGVLSLILMGTNVVVVMMTYNIDRLYHASDTNHKSGW